MLDTNDKIRQSRERADRSKVEGFARFLEKPLVKVSLARMPATENNEIVELLRASYVDGHDTGAGDALGGLLESVFKSKGRNE